MSDLLVPSCERTIDSLITQEITSYLCSLENVTTAFANTATVTATAPDHTQVIASDIVQVEVPFVYLPIILKPEPLTILYVTTQNTGGVSLLKVMEPENNALVHSCANIPDNTVNYLCGAFPPGTYQVEAQTRRCGILRAQKTWPVGPVTVRIWCE